MANKLTFCSLEPNQTIVCAYYPSPIGTLMIEATSDAICGLEFISTSPKKNKKNNIVEQCLKQLDEYFQEKRKNFTLKLALAGTEFQCRVWKKLAEIPYGKTWSYGEVAKKIGNNKAMRAVGMANAKNKISIILPCHRVIGANGTLTGYGGGLDRKEWLLKHEGLDI